MEEEERRETGGWVERHMDRTYTGLVCVSTAGTHRPGATR